MYKTKQNAMCKLAENWYLCTSLPKSTKEKKKTKLFLACVYVSHNGKEIYVLETKERKI